MTTDLIIQYCVYGGIIVVGIVVLGLFRRRHKLPNHAEVKTKLEALAQKLHYFLGEDIKECSNFEFFKKLAKLIGYVDRMVYETSLLAEKERDMQIESISASLQSVRDSLCDYKYGKKERSDASGFTACLSSVEGSVGVAQNIIARDKELKARRAG